MKLSDAEWKVMQVVWEDHPVVARGVLDALEDETGWAYTTVKTMLSRLVEKGALEARMRGNATEYGPRVSREDARRSAVRSLVDKAFDGAFVPMMRFLADEGLSDADRAALRDVLERAESGDEA